MLIPNGMSDERHIAIAIIDEFEELLNEHNLTIGTDDREDPHKE